MSDEGNAVSADIAARWAASVDQVTNTAAALRERNLTLANAPDEIDRRQRRLSEQGLDLEALVGDDDSVRTNFLSRGSTAARSVGRVVNVALRRDPPVPLATGVLVSPRLLLTNNHVVPGEVDASEAAVQFGFEIDEAGRECEYVTYALAPEVCWFTDEELDFTVVAVADLHGKAPGDAYGWVPLIEQTGKAINCEPLNVIHHPGGDRKRVSIRENRMVAQDELWLRYTSDTRKGSSGAPVFNDQWEMVALHRRGIKLLDASGAPLARSGERWTRDMGPDAAAYMGNEGARVSRIVKRLREAPLDAPMRGLIDAAIEAGASV
ncbi:V8-like Glu-specific endopeptidase [Streptomyces umbrinus]|uniref:Serine protease n=1 Tax=Streptomyces umbrinus TaxID=67370 RepID=A0ABU0T754_9ACTN|nr:serine protease [Streptomyces umbrinus]MDQ1031640.1 V8-like Glu-specific endopeptidase [Streptomyces umbrinus]